MAPACSSAQGGILRLAMLLIHDTLAGHKRPFEPREANKASLYVCGPTVYDVAHLGHARSALVFDVIRRYLTWSGYEVTHVSNVTDVDDKIIARASAEGSTEAEVAVRYEKDYRDLLHRLEVLVPHAIPHATEYISKMLDLIQALVEVGAAYAIQDHENAGVYFDVKSYGDYGALVGRRLEDLLEGAGARVGVDERKRSPVDFALWKAAKPGEPAWDSPWGQGRPGWHIECSAMSLELLGDGFDLHGGGDDLVFPHHENERAQSEAAGHAFARYWLHHGMVIVRGEKMAKSTGNFTTLRDALDAFDPRALRLLVLQTHYRSPMEMGPEHLRDTAAALDRLDALARRVRGVGPDEIGVDGSLGGPCPDDQAAIEAFRVAMDDDFNTPSAIGVLFETVRRANQLFDAGDLAAAATTTAVVIELANVVGLRLDDGAGDTDYVIDELVASRDAARRAGQFDEADRLRSELTALGVVLEDTPTGTVWHR